MPLLICRMYRPFSNASRPAARAGNSPLITDAATCDVTVDVVDVKGAAIAGARVSLPDAANVELRRAATDAPGRLLGSGVDAPGLNAMARFPHRF